MSIEISITEEPLSLPNLMSGNDSQNDKLSPTNETKERDNMYLDNKQPTKVLSNNDLSTIEKSGAKTLTDNVKTQEMTEKTSSPARNPSGIGVTKCPICGKQFGKSSLRFHQPQCEKKQAALQEKHEQAKLEEKRTSSYIIYEDFDTGNIVVPLLEFFSSLGSQ